MTDQAFAEYMPPSAGAGNWNRTAGRSAAYAPGRPLIVLRACCAQNFAADNVIAFGSLPSEGQFDADSDIDLAVSGIAPKRFFRAWADAGNVTGEFDLDLVDFSDCGPALLEKISTDGKPL